MKLNFIHEMCREAREVALCETFCNQDIDMECSFTKTFYYSSPSHAVTLLCTHVLSLLRLAPTVFYILLVYIS